jgi:TRAP-type C4-dicarboxylate transport system permease small subunit
MAGINHFKTWWQKIAEILAGIEKLAVAVCLGGMVALVLIQIILRNFYNSGIVGSDSLVKHLVLWVGFLGAGLATREKSHIRIDIASKVLPPKAKAVAQIFVDVFSITVCLGLVYAAYSFVSIEYEAEEVMPFLQVPVWIMELIIPAGFLIIALRFIMQLFENISLLLKGTNT